MMTSAQVVETSVSVTLNNPSQDYTHPDDHNLPNNNNNNNNNNINDTNNNNNNNNNYNNNNNNNNNSNLILPPCAQNKHEISLLRSFSLDFVTGFSSIS